MRPLVADRRYDPLMADVPEDPVGVPPFEAGYISRGRRDAQRERVFARYVTVDPWGGEEEDLGPLEAVTYHNWDPEQSRQAYHSDIPFPPFSPEIEAKVARELAAERRLTRDTKRDGYFETAELDAQAALRDSYGQSGAPSYRDMLRGEHDAGVSGSKMMKAAAKVGRHKSKSEPRRDPAPSRWAYRMQRVMLTPYLRVLLRVGLPCLILIAAGAIYISDPARRGGLVAKFEELRQEFQQRPEFMVQDVLVEGTSPELAAAVVARLGLTLPISSFDIDLAASTVKIEELDAVKSVDMRVRTGGKLAISVIEREPVVVWRNAQGVVLLDDTGHRVAGLFARADRSDLPLIAGAGAELAVPEVLEVIDALGPLTARMRGLVRVGERRWDLILDRNQKISLPQVQPVRAIERLLALDSAQDILARDVTVVDLRLASRPTLRLGKPAFDELRRAKGLESVEMD